MIKTGIVGATGYTGLELIRILSNHPDVEIAFLSSETHQGQLISAVFPYLKGKGDYPLLSMEAIQDRELDVVFLGLPHGTSMSFVKKHHQNDWVIIDLSGDFRMSQAALYEQWYHQKHQFEEGIHASVYGLPELFREDIRNSSLIANPGCFPTGAILAVYPALAYQLADQNFIVIDAKTGVSGAGIKPKETTHFPAVHNNFMAYGVTTHRHTPEIENILQRVTGIQTKVCFTPHLLPVDRGIYTTAYMKPVKRIHPDELRKHYVDAYKHEPFVEVVDRVPALKEVNGTNHCRIYPIADERTGNIIVISVIDNLIKGASGQAIQNLNIRFGLNEEKALNSLPLNP